MRVIRYIFNIVISITATLLSLLGSVMSQAQTTDSIAAPVSADSSVMTVADTVSGEMTATVDSLASMVQSALPAEALAQQADSAYSADNFTLAEALYLQAMKTGGTSATLFYNLGNAYYRQGNLGKAIVNYERALKLDPTNNDARANLDFVNSKITDKQTDSGSYLDSLWNSTVGMARADIWAVVALVLFAVFLGAVAAYIFSTAVAVKKASFFGGIIVLIVSVCTTVIAFAAANRVNSNNYAIILPPASQLSTSPREARNQAEQALLLHEGTKVEIIDSIASPGDGMWYEVKAGHGDRAWVKASEVERI